jgi:hypothetical protein
MTTPTSDGITRNLALVVILVLGLLGLASLAGIVLLAIQEKSIPDALVGTLGGVTTGVAALLVRIR